MRKTISISMSNELHDYVLEQSRDSTVSEYIRSVIRSERQRRDDDTSRPVEHPRQANDHYVMHALEQIEKLKAILELRDMEY